MSEKDKKSSGEMPIAELVKVLKTRTTAEAKSAPIVFDSHEESIMKLDPSMVLANSEQGKRSLSFRFSEAANNERGEVLVSDIKNLKNIAKSLLYNEEVKAAEEAVDNAIEVHAADSARLYEKYSGNQGEAAEGFLPVEINGELIFIEQNEGVKNMKLFGEINQAKEKIDPLIEDVVYEIYPGVEYAEMDFVKSLYTKSENFIVGNQPKHEVEATDEREATLAELTLAAINLNMLEAEDSQYSMPINDDKQQSNHTTSR